MCEQISAGGRELGRELVREGGRELVREGPIRDIELLVGAKNEKNKTRKLYLHGEQITRNHIHVCLCQCECGD